MKDQTDPSLLHPSAAADLQRRRLLQAMGAMSVVGLPGIAMAQQFPTAKVNTTKLAVTDTEVVVRLTSEVSPSPQATQTRVALAGMPARVSLPVAPPPRQVHALVGLNLKVPVAAATCTGLTSTLTGALSGSLSCRDTETW